DTDRYEWATATTYKKSLFAVALYDLEAGETEVEWKIAKAKISATKANGKLPVFASESFAGSLAEIVGLKYYVDEACTEEISADELAYSTKYYVKAELLNSENFELDESATAFADSAFEYTTPEKQLTIWEKIIKFVTVNWLWFAIGAGALLFLIILICIIAGAKRKKRKREELAEKRRLEKEERDREERRLEREERMARMMQPQMMMPQMMPQGTSQGGQAMAMGGASSNEILELKAEMAAMRTEATLRAEKAAKESAEIKAVQAAEQQVANLLARLGGDQVVTNGVTLDKLTELVEKTVERVLDRREKAAAAPSTVNDGAAAPTAAQVPPDTVMTTVTTTKIDTTKKSAQNAQAAQAAPAGRTVVRNFVAPMPVDDGRVFDVGGFYNPADPVTDDIDNLLGDDNK
ncbi:MAG: hypothetical protein K2I17_05915, partial [Clostridia bacterium]|nr:hypothetical protein [Clostridia bacterium]